MGSVPAGYCRAEGMIRNVNTIEEYRSLDKAAILAQAARTVSLNFEWLLVTADKGTDPNVGLGGHQRRINILMPFTPRILFRRLLRRSQEV